MAKLEISINLDDAGMADYADLASALRDVADRMSFIQARRGESPQEGDGESIEDRNDNRVGEWSIV